MRVSYGVGLSTCKWRIWCMQCYKYAWSERLFERNEIQQLLAVLKANGETKLRHLRALRKCKIARKKFEKLN